MAEVEAVELARKEEMLKSSNSNQKGQDQNISEEIMASQQESHFEMDVTMITSEDKIIADALPKRRH